MGKLWDQMCRDFDLGILDGEDLRRYSKIIFPKDQITAIDAVIKHLESCAV